MFSLQRSNTPAPHSTGRNQKSRPPGLSAGFHSAKTRREKRRRLILQGMTDPAWRDLLSRRRAA